MEQVKIKNLKICKIIIIMLFIEFFSIKIIEILISMLIIIRNMINKFLIKKIPFQDILLINNIHIKIKINQIKVNLSFNYNLKILFKIS